MVVAREHREKLMQYCRAGLVEMAFGIVWEEPGIVRDVGCVPLVAGGNPTMMRVIGMMAERLESMDVKRLAAMADARPPEWTLALARFPQVPMSTLLKFIEMALGDGLTPPRISLCGVVVRRLSQQWNAADRYSELADVMGRLLALGDCLPGDIRRDTNELLEKLSIRPKGGDR